MSENSFQAQRILDHIPAMVGYWDVDLLNRYANRAYSEWFGVTPDELCGLHIRSLLGDELYRLNLPYIEAVLRGQRQEFQRDIPMPDGMSTRHSLAEYVPDIVDGKVQGFFVFVSDISMVVEAQNLLRQHGLLLLERDAKLSAILDNMPYLVWLKDTEGRYIAVNRPYLVAGGKSSFSEVVGKTDIELWPKEMAEKYRADDLAVMTTRKQLSLEEKAIHAGKETWTKTFKTPIIDSAGNVIGTTGMAHDISERKRIEESSKIATMIYQSSSEAMLVTDEHNQIIDANPAFTQITGYALDDIRGLNPSVFQSGKHDAAFYQAMWEAIKQGDSWHGEIWDKRKNGDIYAKIMTINLIRDEHGKPFRYVALFSDITDKKITEQLVWSQANIDSLTQLPNRRLFGDRLEQEVRKAHRCGTKFTLLFIDLDHFKQINDTLGHQAGDALLAEAAKRISGCVRESDTVARLGGDEFTVILSDLHENVQLERVVRTIIDSLAAPFHLSLGVSHVSASIGITRYPHDAQTVDGLLKCADQAMYSAKEAGRNSFTYFLPSMQESVMQRYGLGNDLRAALSNHELEVYFQPIVEINSEHTHKAEALLRWNHPKLGMNSPEVFIPLAEDTGVIHQIGYWVFQQSAAFAKRIRSTLGLELQISVNKSPVQFARKSGETEWLDYLVELGLSGSSIAVEITEGLLLNKDANVQSRLKQLRDAGVQVSIDDFGTGFSSLAYLKKFEIDYLKIDQSFVRNLGTDNDDLAIVEAIIAMARKLRIKTIAEGVETQLQLNVLHAIGCDYAQGYYFSKPLPADQFERWLTRSLQLRVNSTEVL